MKKILRRMLALACCLCMSCMLFACDSGGKKTIGVIQYAEHPALDAAYKGFVAGLKANGYGSSKVKIEKKNAQGDASNCETIAEKFVNDNDSLIYAIATPAAQAVANKTKDIPVVISAVTDPKTSGLVKSNKKPGTNVTGTSDLTPVESQIKLLKQILPNAKKIAIMYCGAEDNSIYQAKIAKKAAKDAGLEYMEATVSDSTMIQSVTESLIGKVDAIYIPTDNLLAEGMSNVSEIANANGLPTIVGESGMCESGGLATVGINYYELGKKSGKMAAQVLDGKDPSGMAIEYQSAKESKTYINYETAKKLGITIPDSVKNNAKDIKDAD